MRTPEQMSRAIPLDQLSIDTSRTAHYLMISVCFAALLEDRKDHLTYHFLLDPVSRGTTTKMNFSDTDQSKRLCRHLKERNKISPLPRVDEADRSIFSVVFLRERSVDRHRRPQPLPACSSRQRVLSQSL